MNEIKFCKNCMYSKIIVEAGFDREEGERHCFHPKIHMLDLVDGHMPITILTSCANQRYGTATALLDCGVEAKYFQPKSVN